MVEEQDPLAAFSPLELEKVQSIPKAVEFTTLSADTLDREYHGYIVQLSKRRRGLRLKHLLGIAAGTLPRSPRPAPAVRAHHCQGHPQRRDTRGADAV